MSDHLKRGSSDEGSPPNNTRPGQSDNKHRPGDSKQGNQDTQSLAARIQESASGLARNVFLSSVPLADTADLLSNGSKATPSSSSMSALAVAEQYRESSGLSSSSSRNQASYGAAESLRSSATQASGFELPALTEDEFQSTYGGDFMETIDTGRGKGKGKETNIDSRRTGDSRTTLLPSDGDAVVSILSDKTFDPEFPPSANEPPEYVDTELSPPQLTPAEIRMIESFRRQLPPESILRQGPDPSAQLNPLSLVPDIGSFLDTFPASNTNTSHATSLRDAVLTSLPGAMDWVSVEEKYHDEVWGYLQPTLEAAAKEIESSKDSPGSEEGPAVRRLKMILKHMQH